MTTSNVISHAARHQEALTAREELHCSLGRTCSMLAATVQLSPDDATLEDAADFIEKARDLVVKLRAMTPAP